MLCRSGTPLPQADGSGVAAAINAATLALADAGSELRTITACQDACRVSSNRGDGQEQIPNNKHTIYNNI